MQIIDKNGKVTVKLTQHEGRQLRSAAYIAKRIAVNISDTDRAGNLTTGASVMLEAANEFTPEAAQEKLDKQDAETVPVAVPEESRRRRQPAK